MKDTKRIKWKALDNLFDRAVIIAFAKGEVSLRALKELSTIGANLEGKKLISMGVGRARNLALQAINKRQWQKINMGEELTGKHALNIQATKEKKNQ